MMTQSRGNKGPVALILLPAVTVDVTFATATGAERLTLDATRAGGKDAPPRSVEWRQRIR
jgi:hypothetical protein